MIKVKNLDLVNAEPVLSKLVNTKLDNVPQQVKVKFKYWLFRLIGKIQKELEAYNQSKQEIVENKKYIKVDKAEDGKEIKEFSKEGQAAIKTLLEIEVDIDINPLKVPCEIFTLDDLTALDWTALENYGLVELEEPVE